MSENSDFVKSEEVRQRFSDEIRTLSADRPLINIGTNATHLIYQLVWINGMHIPASCVLITGDRARKHWSDVRAAVRLNDYRFLISVDGAPRAILQRHPGYRNAEVERWRAEREPSLSIGAERTASAVPEDRLGKVEALIAALDRRVANLEPWRHQ